MANLGLASGCSCPFSLVLLSASLSQSEVANLVGHSFPNRVHMAQYLGSSLACVEDVGGVGEGGVDYHLLTDFLTLGPV